MSVATRTLINVKIFVDDISATMAVYDAIEVYRSVNSSGPWEPVAAVPGAAASIVAHDRSEPFLLHGKTLELKFNGTTTVTVSFSGPDPYPLSTVVSDVNAAIGTLGVASGTDDGHLRIDTAAIGNDASIEVTGGDYANVGFQYMDTALGVDNPVSLVAGQQDYVCVDNNGDPEYWYRTRFINTSTLKASEYSAPFRANAVPKLPATDLITGTCHLVDLRGNGLPGQVITIYNLMEPSSRSGYGILGMDLTIVTDKDGYAHISLVRGSLIEAAFVGTPVRRRIRVPTDPSLTEFDLLDPKLAEDEFGIQVPDIRLAERRYP